MKKGQLPKDYKPSVTDILCGRGGSCLEHPGNKIFSEVVRANVQKYIEAPKRFDKGIVVSSVVDSIKKSGVRFIKQDKHSKLYCELSHDQAHEKTGHAIRDLLKNDTRPAGRKMAKKKLPVDTEGSRKRWSVSRDCISKSVSQELSSQAQIMPSKIVIAVLEISDAIWSIDDGDFTHDLSISENLDVFDHLLDDNSNSNPVDVQLGDTFDSNLLKNEQEQGGYVIASPFLAPLPLSSETRIGRADIRRLFEILSKDHSCP
jgi:hypothetical protein